MRHRLFLFNFKDNLLMLQAITAKPYLMKKLLYLPLAALLLAGA